MPDENNETNQERTLTNMLEKHKGDALKLADALLTDNARYREKNRILSEKVPAGDAVIFSAEDAKRFKAFQDLGKEPDELMKAVQRLPELEKANKELSQMENLRAASLAHAFKLPALQEALNKFPDYELTIKQEKDKETNNMRDVAYIRTGGSESSLDAFVDEHKLADVYALKAEPTQNNRQSGTTAGLPVAGAPSNLFDNIRKQAEEKKKAQPPVTSLRELAGRII